MNVQSKNILLLCFIIVFVFSSAITQANGGSPKGKPFVEIQGQFVEVEGKLKSLEEQMDELVGHVESLEERVTANKSAITALEAENVVIQNKINELVTLSSENNSDVLNALNQIHELQEQIEAMDPLMAEDIAVIKDQILELQNYVASNTAGLQTLVSQLEINSGLIEGLESQVVDIDNQLAQKQDILSGRCPDGTVVRYFDGQGNVECEAPSTTAGVSVTTVTQLFSIPAKRVWTSLEICGTSGSVPCNCGFWGCESCPIYVYCSVQHEQVGQKAASITCPDSEFLAGGGWINDYPEFVYISGTSSGTTDYPGQTWTVTATNTSETQYDLYATANCVSFLP